MKAKIKVTMTSKYKYDKVEEHNEKLIEKTYVFLEKKLSPRYNVRYSESIRIYNNGFFGRKLLHLRSGKDKNTLIIRTEDEGFKFAKDVAKVLANKFKEIEIRKTHDIY